MMRIFKPILLLLVAVLSCTMSCVKPGDGSTDATPSITFSSNPLSVPAETGRYTTKITSSAKWTATSKVDWISDLTQTLSGNLSFQVSENPLNSVREGSICFSFEGSSYTEDLVVCQEAWPEDLTAGVTDVKLETGGSRKAVRVFSRNWEVKAVSDTWLNAEKQGDSELVLTADVNFYGVARSASVTVTDGSKEAVINVAQEYSREYFKNASTLEGRKLVHGLGTMVTQVNDDKFVQVADGLSYIHLSYTGQISGTAQNSAFFLYEVDLTSAMDLAVTCSGDDPSSIKRVESQITAKDIIRKQLADLQKNRPEVKVLGGVNGDFFYIEESSKRGNLLQGIMWRKGVCLKDTFDGGAGCSVFATMKDGTARVMTQSEYAASKSDIYEALGGRQRIVQDGKAVNPSDKTLEPRTAVGVSEDGKKVYILVFDGRKSYWSTGANYDMMAVIFLAVGAKNAINLDGGGSSTFALLKDNAAGTSEDDYTALNKVSDGTDRKVVNGLAIVQKQ